MMDVSRHRSVDTLRGYVRDAEIFNDHAGAGLLSPYPFMPSPTFAHSSRRAMRYGGDSMIRPKAVLGAGPGTPEKPYLKVVTIFAKGHCPATLGRILPTPLSVRQECHSDVGAGELTNK
jgi:hypothetical protein